MKRLTCDHSLDSPIHGKGGLKGFPLKFKKTVKEWVFTILERLVLFSEKRIDKSAIQKILVFEGGGIGDLLLLFPAIRAIQGQFRNASISFLVSPHAGDILKQYPSQEKFLEIIEYEPKGKQRSFFKKLGLLQEIRKKGYDLIYAPSRGEGMREVVLMTYLMGATYRLGFQKERTGFLHTHRVEFHENRSILQQNLALLKQTDIAVDDETIKIEIPEKDALFAREFLDRRKDFTGPLIAMHVAAEWKATYKCWPLNQYIELMSRLINHDGATIVLLGSPKEAGMGEVVSQRIKGDPLMNAMGETTISQMSAVINCTDFFIGNDSGPLHIALALKIPSIGIFGPTSPDQILSASTDCRVVKSKMHCSPCYTHQFSFEKTCQTVECLEKISVSEVYHAFEKLHTEIGRRRSSCE